MKFALSLLALITISSTSHAWVEVEYKCESTDKTVSFDVSATNAPDFELAGFDSKDTTLPYNVSTNVIVEGKEVQANLKVNSVNGGDDNLRANVTVEFNGKSEAKNFDCSFKMNAPQDSLTAE